MAINQNIKEAIANLQNVLEDANDLGELKSFLKREYLSFVSHWNQCDQMRKFDNYGGLKGEINEISKHGDTWFYIGYTGKLGNYLWTTTPKSEESLGLVKSHELVKSSTYYTHLEGRAAETEHNLINTFIDRKNCLNVDRSGIESTNGIVYVLVYKSPSGN